MKILAITPYLPQPDRSAGCRRFVAILSHLAGCHCVDLYVTSGFKTDGGTEKSIDQLRKAGVNLLPTDRWGWLRGCLLRKRYDFGLFEFWSEAEETVPLFRNLQPWAKVVVDTVDVHFAREEAAIPFGLLAPEVVASNRNRELAVYRSVDAVVVVSAEDDRLLRDCGGVAEIHLIPIIVPTREHPPSSRSPEVLFVGGFAHQPNIDGVLWFVRETWPLIRSQVPEATFTVVGSSPPPDIQSLHGQNGVTVTGYVPDTGSFLDRAAVSVAPLRYGGGMKGKVSEALAAGLPVVTTTVGAQGFGIVSGEHASVADTPGDFASAVIAFLSNQEFAARIGLAGQQLANRVCTAPAVNHKIDELVASLDIASFTRPGMQWRLRAARAHVTAWIHDLTLRRFRKLRKKVS